MDEVKVVDPLTGGVKGKKLARFSLIPSEFLWALAEHYGKGEQKYAARNWEKGYAWSLTVDAIGRHLNEFLLGERYDHHRETCSPDCKEHTGSHHLVAAAWHCIALFIFDVRAIGTDDIRPKEKAPHIPVKGLQVGLGPSPATIPGLTPWLRLDPTPQSSAPSREEFLSADPTSPFHPRY